MSRSTVRHRGPLRAWRGPCLVTAGVLVLVAAASAAEADRGGATGTVEASRTVSFHGLRLEVPRTWEVVDLATRPHACLRFDRAALYLGSPGDQRSCPASVIGGAPGLQLEALDERSLRSVAKPTVTVSPAGDVHTVQLPSSGPASVAVEGAGVLLTATYGARSAPLMQRILSGAELLTSARPALVSAFPGAQIESAAGANVPGNYRGKGFDACTAPSQAAMDAWRRSSEYAAIGAYIGGVSRGCAQPNLTASWVSRQVSNGWHLVPTYVGRQAPCSRFSYRISYDVATARTQGRADAADAVRAAKALGIAAPSTIYSDMEGYDNTIPGCVASVLGYLSGWTFTLERNGYMSGVYSSASSGIRDLSTHYKSTVYTRPDDIWMAWWNGVADVDGGSYVPDDQWRNQQRVHQYAGNVTETYGGFTIQIDRDFLDVSAWVKPPKGCPTNLDFAAYPAVGAGAHGNIVVAAQCLLARAGFDPGAATGTFGWRTDSAVRAFKASRGLDSGDSVIRRWAWTALAAAGPTQFLQRGARGSRVRKVQRALTARLQRTVDISGDFDGQTERAVKDYQRLLHLTQTGTVGTVTWQALHSGR